MIIAVTALSSADTPPAEQSQPNSDPDILRSRLLERYYQQPINIDQVRRLMTTLSPDGSWPDVDYADQNKRSWKPLYHLYHLDQLTNALTNPKSPIAGDPELKGAVFRALCYWLDKDYSCINWWYNQIGTPKTLAPILLMLDDQLDDLLRKQGLIVLSRAKLGRTGQNLVWLADITLQRGIIEHNDDTIMQAVSKIADEIRITSEEGIQADYSFHQHGPCLYSHGYGACFAVDCSKLMDLCAGTKYQFPQNKIDLLSHYILDGSQWMARGPYVDYGAIGRQITRENQSARYLGEVANYMLNLPTHRDKEFADLAARIAGQGAPLIGNRYFWRSDIAVHHRHSFYASARFYGRGTANTDGTHCDEGLLSHHIADGCTFIMRDGTEYENIFPVWDWRKIPGTTVEQKPELTPKKEVRIIGTSDLAGGVSDGMTGAAAFELTRDALSIRKSWFFFDKEIVCLGAGLKCDSQNPVATTINQCHLRSDVYVHTANKTEQLAPGSHSFEEVGWVYHDRIAYRFTQPIPIRLTNAEQQGNWHRISHSIPDQTTMSLPVFKLWIDHTPLQENDSYIYSIIPDIDLGSMDAYQKQNPICVLHNTSSLQAVHHKQNSISTAIFYEPSTLRIRSALLITPDRPCLVHIKELPEQLRISVAGFKNQSGPLQLEICQIPRETPTQTQSQILSLELPSNQHAGQTITRTIDRF